MIAAARLLNILGAMAIVALLGGCAVGQTYNYADAPVGLAAVSTAGTVRLAVHDMRPYVLSGNKPETFAGLIRGGYGNPFDVNTQSGKALAAEIAEALARALRQRGANPVPVAVAASDSAATVQNKLLAAQARRSVLVTLREWKTDTMMRTDLHYDATVQVFDERGSPIASRTLRGMDALGVLGMTPHEGVSKASAQKLDALFDDPRILAALK